MRLIAAAVLALFGLMFLAAPAHAVSSISVSPSSVSTGDSVSITLTQIVGPLPDAFLTLRVTDPVGDVFAYQNTPVIVSSSVQITFPNGAAWTCVSGPCANTGTDVSGTYTVSGSYSDPSLSILLGRFVVLSAHDSFSVPEFSQPLLAMVAMILPALLLARRRGLSRKP